MGLTNIYGSICVSWRSNMIDDSMVLIMGVSGIEGF
jgi:hypothetical protein